MNTARRLLALGENYNWWNLLASIHGWKKSDL
jgi:hypothetical protein